MFLIACRSGDVREVVQGGAEPGARREVRITISFIITITITITRARRSPRGAYRIRSYPTVLFTILFYYTIPYHAILY